VETASELDTVDANRFACWNREVSIAFRREPVGMDEEALLRRVEELIALLHASPDHAKLQRLLADMEDLAERLRPDLHGR
jgi:hypothetical protein